MFKTPNIFLAKFSARTVYPMAADIFLKPGATASCGYVHGLLKLFSENCLCVCIYACLHIVYLFLPK